MTKNSEKILSTILALGFRPFFLLGSIAGIVSLTVWLVSFYGVQFGLQIDSLWHAHEMVHGFVLAIVVGFLLTASGNWSNKRGVHGMKLAVLVSTWLLARILFLVPDINVVLRATVDLAFLPLAIFFLFPYLVERGKKRNSVFVVLLLSFWFCNVVYHLETLGFKIGYGRMSLLLAIQIVVLILVIIAGRVIPFFSVKAISGYKRAEIRWLNPLTVVSTVAFAVTYTIAETGTLTSATGFVAGGLHFARLAVWFDRRVWRRPVLLILYAGYFGLVIGFITSGVAALGGVSPSLATHAFTLGAISVMIVGMMSRVTLGHTGRDISASRLTMVAYVFIVLGAISRVVGPIVFPAAYVEVVVVAGVLWICSLGCFVYEYGPLLVSPRIDGKPG